MEVGGDGFRVGIPGGRPLSIVTVTVAKAVRVSVVAVSVQMTIPITVARVSVKEQWKMRLCG